VPKPVVPLLNVPFLAYQLALLRGHGITDVVLSCSYMVDEVERVMGDGRAHGVRLRYAVETEPLGTAGGVRNAAHLVGRLVLVLNGDILTDADLTAMRGAHAERGAAATIDLFPVPDPSAYGLVELEASGRVRRFIEKPSAAEVTTNTINAGIYLLDRALLDRIPGGQMVSIEREFFPGLVADGVPFYGWVGDHYWLDIGSPEKYRRAQLDLMAGKVASAVAADSRAARIGDGVVQDATAVVAGACVIGAGSRLDAECRVGPDAVLGRRCVIGRSARVAGSVIWDDVAVGPDAVLADCIVASGARIGAGAHVGPGTVLEAGRTVPDGAHVS
jgi:NDP-sugar pyrophosphorylase family protein